MERIGTKPFLAEGEIMHRRLFPRKNRFVYRSTYVAFPLSKIGDLKRRFFSLERFNLFGLRAVDYGEKNPCGFEEWIHGLLRENEISGVDEIVLITHPRILGYVFNPVSFWLCLNQKRELIAVLSEVNNTCGQKHCYLCHKEDLEPIRSEDWLEAKKEFYVSPFMETEGFYRFRFAQTEKGLDCFINLMVDGKLKLGTYLKCNLKEFSDWNLLRAFFKIPFATLKTTLLIHWQALILYSKLRNFRSCPEKSEKHLTIGKS